MPASSIRRALFRLPARIDYAALPRVTYTEPRTGAGRHDRGGGARGRPSRRHPALAAGRQRPRGRRERERPGWSSWWSRGNRVLGAGILAPNAGEMIGLWTLAIAQRTKLNVLASLIVPYPTRVRGGKARGRQLLRPAPVRSAYQVGGPPAGPVALRRKFNPICGHEGIARHDAARQATAKPVGSSLAADDARGAAERDRGFPPLHRARAQQLAARPHRGCVDRHARCLGWPGGCRQGTTSCCT